MELIFSKWVSAFLLCCRLIFSVGHSVEGLHGNSRVRAVNLGGWLLVEGWIKPSHFDDIPNGDMLNGGGLNVSVDRDNPLEWETFKLRRVSESVFQFRTAQGQFLTCSGDGASVTATAESSSDSETFYLERNSNNRVHIKLKSGTYIQASNDNVFTADFRGTPGWDDYPATFEMTIVGKLQGDYQLANGYGHDNAKEVLKRHGINTVRIPVGWWIVSDTNPPAPFIGGSLEVLDNAFSWSQAYNLKCIIDLHAAPDSQNGMEHSASRDGTVNWQTSPEYVSQTLDVIEFLASRYAVHPALLGIELLNEASAADVSLDILVPFYKQGYQIVRKYSQTAYVIFCQRIGNADPFELYQANIGSLNTVVDLHYYNLFDIYFGEWVNEWNVTKLFLSGLPGFRKSSVRCV